MMKSLTATRSCGAAVLLHVLAVSVLFPTHASAFLSDEQPEGAYGGYELGAIAAEAADHDPSEASSSSYYGDDDAARVHGKGTGKGKGKGGKGMGMGNPSVSGGDGECNICGDSADSKGGKINSLTFRWDATVPGTTANIQADGVSSTIAHLTVADGEEVTFEPDRGYFRADTGFDINDELVNLHTSCSQPIYRGKWPRGMRARPQRMHSKCRLNQYSLLHIRIQNSTQIQIFLFLSKHAWVCICGCATRCVLFRDAGERIM